MASQLILALEWKDESRDYLDVLANTFDHPSYLELDNNAQVNEYFFFFHGPFCDASRLLFMYSVVHASC